MNFSEIKHNILAIVKNIVILLYASLLAYLMIWLVNTIFLNICTSSWWVLALTFCGVLVGLGVARSLSYVWSIPFIWLASKDLVILNAVTVVPPVILMVIRFVYNVFIWSDYFGGFKSTYIFAFIICLVLILGLSFYIIGTAIIYINQTLANGK